MQCFLFLTCITKKELEQQEVITIITKSKLFDGTSMAALNISWGKWHVDS